MSNKKLSLVMAVLVAVGLIVSACTTPEPEVIEVEKVVTQVVKEKVVETVVVEGTPQVVEKEVTKIVEVEKVVTPTPEEVAEGEAGGECVCGYEVISAINGDTNQINPILAHDTDGYYRSDMLFDSLITLDPVTTEPVPRLAESWDISEDGTTYTFHLTDADVRFHDGEPFSVEDIEFTLMEILKPTYTGIYQGRFSDLVGADKVIAGEATELEGFQIIDDKTIQFKLNTPSASFLAIAIRDLKFLPKHLLEGEEITEDHPFNLAPIGTGQYKFVEWDKGNRFVMEWNEDYWGEKPCAKRIVSVGIPDMQAIALALEAGDVDLSITLPPTEVPRLAQVEGLTYYKMPAVTAESLWFNLKHPILSDLRVRKAIGHAIDPLAFTEGVLQGTTDPANSHLPPSSWAYYPGAKTPEYNIEKAKALLAEAGYPDGFEIKLACNQGNFFRELFVEYAQAELAKIGIKAEVIKPEWGTFIGSVIDGEYEMRFHNQTGGFPDPDIIYEIFHTGGDNNYSFYSNEEVDRLLEEARVEPDLEKRRLMYQQIMILINDDLPTIPMFWRPAALVAKSKFENVLPSVFYDYGSIQYWCMRE